MSITLEYVNDPRWYAITSLPYVQKEGDISTIGISDRWFSQAIGQRISYQLPQLKEMYRHVLNTYPSISKGQLNGFEDVKSNPLIATTWVSEADDEIKKWYDFIAFYDVNKLNTGMDKDMKILSERINEDGGFSWVPGFRSDVYVTQYVLENLTRAYQLGALNLNGNSVSNLISRMIKYVDQEAIKRYNIFHEHK